ncbi:MAG TPA: hypothetical protein VNX00_03440 [Herbaspirillum sp.]|nr:hypothetical protein [Herbaspirillum sp.]
MTTTRTKRWNGHIETLKSDYLKEIMVQMDAYGDRLQLALSGPGQRPHYQVINPAGKKMAFDSNHHLLSQAEDAFTPGNVTEVYTLEQVKTIAAGGSVRIAGSSRVTRTGNGITRTTRNTAAVIKAKDLIDVEKYDYFKNNRETLPPTIGEHSAQITDLMKGGKSAEDAFNEVLKQHY